MLGTCQLCGRFISTHPVAAEQVYGRPVAAAFVTPADAEVAILVRPYCADCVRGIVDVVAAVVWAAYREAILEVLGANVDMPLRRLVAEQVRARLDESFRTREPSDLRRDR